MLHLPARAAQPTGQTITYTNGQVSSTAYTTTAPNNNLILAISSSGSATQSGLLSGSGSVELTGSLRYYTFTANNTYTGGTIITQASLQLGNGGTSGSVLGNIENNGDIRFNRSDEFTFAGTISGSGYLSITSGGVRFTNPQSYTGATLLNPFTTLVLPTAFDQGLSASSIISSSSSSVVDISNRSLRVTGLTGNGRIISSGGNSGQLIIDNPVGSPTTFSGIIGSGANSALALVKSGPGTFTLTDVNFYTEGTTVNAGTLALSGTFATFGQDNRPLTLNGGTLDLGGLSRSVSTVTFSGGTVQNGTLTAANLNARSGSSSATLDGSSALTKTTNGTFTLSGSNTYSGGTVINGGLINFSSLANFGSGPVTLNGGGLQWAPGNTLDVTVGSPFDNILASAGGTFDTNGNSITLAGILSGPGSFTKAGAGNLTLTAPNTFSGGTTISAGTLVLGNPLALQSSTLTAPSSGSLSFGSLTTATLGGLTGSANLTLTNASSAPVTLSVGNNGANTSYTGTLSGSGVLSKVGPGTLTLSTSHAHTGGTSVAGGNLTVSATANLGTGPVTVNSGTLAVSSAANLGTGPVTVNGGTLASSVNLTFDRTVNVSGGSARLSTVGFFEFAVPSSSNATFTVANGGNVTVGSSAAFGNTGGSIGPVLITGAGSRFNVGTKLFLGFAGAGSLTVSSGGTLAAPIISFGEGGGSGTLNLNPGGFLELGGTIPFFLGNAGTFNFAGGTIRVTGSALSTSFPATLSNNSTIDTNGLGATVSSIFSGPGSLTKAGAGTLTLTGANTYGGGTIISDGTLQLGNGSNAGSLTGNVSNNGTFVINRSDDYTFPGVISGPGGLTSNSGILRFSSAQSYSGPTVVNSGYFVLPTSADQGLSASSRLTVASGAFVDLSNRALTVAGLSGAGTIYSSGGSSGQLTVNNSAVSPSTFSGIIGGGFGSTPYPNFALAKSGNGTLTLAGNNAYTGGTSINGGTVVMAHPSALGTGSTILNATGTLDSASYGFNLTRLSGNGGTLTGSGLYSYNAASSATLAAALAGSASLTKSGAGTLTLAAPNSYSGGTTLAAGTLALAAPGALGTTGPILLSGGTLQFSASDASDYSARFSNAANQRYNFDTNGQNVTLSSSLNSSGGSLSKSGAGTLTLAALNTYLGVTTLSAGTLQLGNGGTAGIINGDIVNNGVLAVNRSDTAVLSGNITGSGSLTKSGAGSLILSGSNSYAGPTTITGGAIQAGSINNIGSGPISISGGAFFASSSFGLNRTVTVSNLSTFNASANLDFGTVGGTSGTLTITDGSLVTAGGSLTLGAMLGASGSGSVTGPGSRLQVGNFIYLGSLSSSSGTLSIGSGGTVAAGKVSFGSTSNSFGTLNLNSGGTLEVGGTDCIVRSGNAAFNFAGGTLRVTGSALTSSVNATLSNTSTVDTNDFDTTLSGVFDGTGSLVKSGYGILFLTAANSYSGGTTISGGTLQIGNGGTTGSIAGNVLNQSSLVFNRSNNSTFSGTISGPGSLTKSGAGTLVLAGANTYTGDTTVNGGTLSLSSPSLSSAADVILEPGATLDLNFTGTDTIDEFYIDGVRQRAGTWSAPGGGGTFTSSRLSGTGTLTVTRSPATFESFIATYFTPAEILAGVITTQTADPDADGLPNLLEYAFELNPRIPNSGVTSLSVSSGYLTLSYPRRTDEDLSGLHLFYRVQVSSDLITWNDGAEFTELVSSVPVPGTNHALETVRDLTPLPSPGRRFIRLSVRLDN